MHEPRKSTRFDASGKAKIAIASKCKFFIRNLSITGCCLGCILSSDKIKTNEKYKVKVKPERKAHVCKFELDVECRWIRNREDLSEFGFEIYTSPKGKNFQNYVDYLSFRSSLQKTNERN